MVSQGEGNMTIKAVNSSASKPFKIGKTIRNINKCIKLFTDVFSQSVGKLTVIIVVIKSLIAILAPPFLVFLLTKEY